MSGFKSFAKKTTMIFDSPITAIVGPNGSGKSNVAEAFRWVLGEQSMKSLRGKRGEDLIFNGSSGSSRLNHASVILTFNNKDKKFNIDFDEVAIARHVYRDGTNQYFINGSQVRLKDVIELLSVVSLGVSSHHIISQGEADRILNANIFERREMVENALGLRVYQYKKDESERRLAKTEENIKQVESLRREIAPHLKFLKKQVDEIKKAEEMRKELFGLYVEYLKREDWYLKNYRSELEKEKVGPEAELKNIEVELGRLSALLSSASDKDADRFNKVRELENTLADIRRKKDELGRKIGRLEGMIEANPLARFDEESPTEVKKCRYCGQDLPRVTMGVESGSFRDNLLVEIEKHKQDKTLAESELLKCVASERDILAQHSNLKSEIEKKKETLRDSERALYELRSRRSELQSGLGTVRVREERLIYEENALETELTEATVLVGRAILDYYPNFVFDENKSEDRTVQEERKKKIERIKIRLEDMGGSGEEVLKEFNETTERDQYLEREINDLLKSRESLTALMNELTEKVDQLFRDGVVKINTQFQEFFSLMFGGGSASLAIINPPNKRRENAMGDIEEIEDLREGIDIDVSLPRKRVKGLQMLSGGERALTSIALLFAISQVNPPPFLILDETDAALDESNSRKYGDMIENLSKYSQLIVVTHNRETMSRASVLYGVTMGGDGVSKLLSIKFEEAVAVAK